MNSGRIGIDLGTTYSCCGVFKNNNVELVSYKTGMRTVPSHVYYNPKTPEIVVGSAVINNISSIGHDVFDSKRFIGRKFRDLEIQEDMLHWPFKVVEGENGEPLVELEYNNRTVKLTANDISTEILKIIKYTADVYLGQDPTQPTEAVVTVPAYFNNQQRQNTIEAARKANLKVIKIINEPTAAAIAYAHQCIERGGNKGLENLLIYDFGGGTFDVSIIRINFETKIITVLATGGDSHLGGEDIDQRLVEYYINVYRNKTGKKVSDRQQFQLKRACNEAKCLLSGENIDEVSVNWTCLEDEEIDDLLTLSLLSQVNKDIYEKTLSIVDDVVEDSGLEREEIKYIVLVGGSSRIKKVQELIKEQFPEKTIVCRDINPDEVVAYGACLYANINSMRFDVKDVISHTISTDIVKDDEIILHPLIKRNTPIPFISKEAIKFANADDGSDRIDISVFEGEGKYPNDENVKQLDSKPFYISKKDVKAGSYIIETLYNVDENGILTIEVKDRQENGRKEILEIKLK